MTTIEWMLFAVLIVGGGGGCCCLNHNYDYHPPLRPWTEQDQARLDQWNERRKRDERRSLDRVERARLRAVRRRARQWPDDVARAHRMGLLNQVAED